MIQSPSDGQDLQLTFRMVRRQIFTSWTPPAVTMNIKILTPVAQRAGDIPTISHLYTNRSFTHALYRLSLSGGFTPCRHLRPSSGREHVVV